MTARRRFQRAVAATACMAAAATVGWATPSVAADTTTTVPRRTAGIRDDAIARLKAIGNTEVDRRLATLTVLGSRISESRHLSDTDRARLTKEVNDEKAGLTSLKAKINADTDLATLRNDVHAIIVDYRVYVLVVPQVRLTTAADAVLDLSDRFTTLEGRITTRLSRAKEAGNDVSALEAALRDADAKVAAAKQLAVPLPDQLGPLTPAGYPGNRSMLLNARQALRDARTNQIAGVSPRPVSSRVGAGRS